MDIGQARCNFTFGKDAPKIEMNCTSEIDRILYLQPSPKTIMADTERGLENRAFPNPRFCFE